MYADIDEDNVVDFIIIDKGMYKVLFQGIHLQSETKFINMHLCTVQCPRHDDCIQSSKC